MSSLKFQKALGWRDVLRTVMNSKQVDHVIIVIPHEGAKAFSALHADQWDDIGLQTILAMKDQFPWVVGFRAKELSKGEMQFLPIILEHDMAIREYSVLETILRMGGLSDRPSYVIDGEYTEIEEA